MPFCIFAVVFSPALLVSYANDSIQQEYIDPVLDAKVPFPEHIKPNQEWEKRIISLLFEIKDIYLKKDIAYELLIKTKLYGIWYLLYSCVERTDMISVQNNDYRIPRIKSVLNYIHTSYDRKITIFELSNAFNMSDGQFCRFFKSMVKMSVVNYINCYRINESVTLLQKTDKAIGEIASIVGFNNISYYNKTFRRYMHCAPSEFRFPLRLH
jgi:AraC-like DNA-binding protein